MHGRADVVVLDHHKAEGPPPAILATVNPNRLDCGSGLGTLCAAGVAFLTAVGTVRALRRRGFFAGRRGARLMALLDLVALATVCDVMPLTGLNRALVTQGLKVMARRERPGIAALLEVTQARRSRPPPPAASRSGPRINAAGRISEADLGLRLLLCDDPVEARGAGRDAGRGQPPAPGGRGRRCWRPPCRPPRRRSPPGARRCWWPGADGTPAWSASSPGGIKERFNRPACVAGMADGIAKGSRPLGGRGSTSARR